MFDANQGAVADEVSNPSLGSAETRLRAAGGPLLDKELLRAQRVATDQLQQEDLDWLAKGFRAYLASEGRLPLERCLRLPTNDASRQRAIRDHWLRVAWKRVPGDLTPWCRSERLGDAINRFRATQWLRWKSLKTTSAAEGSMEAALLEAFKAHDRIPSTAMQLHNIAQQGASD